jgi:uncharacterized membrane protein YfcA
LITTAASRRTGRPGSPWELAGGYLGARLQARLPETITRRLLALTVVAIGIRYLWAGIA